MCLCSSKNFQIAWLAFQIALIAFSDCFVVSQFVLRVQDIARAGTYAVFNLGCAVGNKQDLLFKGNVSM